MAWNVFWHAWAARQVMLWSFSNLFRYFTYVTAHSPSLPLLYLCHSSFSNHSVASPMLQLILQPFRRFTYVTAHSPTLPSLYLRHSSFSNPSFASPTSQGALISAWGAFTCLKYRPSWDPRLYFPSEESHTQDYTHWKKKSINTSSWTARQVT